MSLFGPRFNAFIITLALLVKPLTAEYPARGFLGATR
jgi:hypothetical protein